MHYRYIPIIRWKRGEQTALKTVYSAAQDVFPFVLVNEEMFKDKPETMTQEGTPASFLFAEQAHKNWGARPFYLDASGVPSTSKGVHPLIATAKLCRELGAHLIPATTLGAPAPYEAAVQAVSQTDGRGVALRVGLGEFTSAADWVSSWPHAPNQTDLIVDLRDKASLIADLGSSLDAAFRNLHLARKWRTVTIAGTSMPENFVGFNSGVHIIKRAELLLWKQLIQLGLSYRLDYGDYATVPLVPAPSGIKWGYPINVRYTLPEQFLICRGVVTRGEGAKDLDVQLVGHANSIVKYRKRARLNCWADKTIDKIAAQEESPGNLENWVKIGVSRHIERVRADTP